MVLLLPPLLHWPPPCRALLSWTHRQQVPLPPPTPLHRCTYAWDEARDLLLLLLLLAASACDWLTCGQRSRTDSWVRHHGYDLLDTFVSEMD